MKGQVFGVMTDAALLSERGQSVVKEDAHR
jgi:hypothetical protein